MPRAPLTDTFFDRNVPSGKHEVYLIHLEGEKDKVTWASTEEEATQKALAFVGGAPEPFESGDHFQGGVSGRCYKVGRKLAAVSITPISVVFKQTGK